MAKKVDLSVPVSDKTLEGMSLNIDDRIWIKRSLDELQETWNDAFDKNISELTKSLGDVIHESNTRMFSILEEQNKLIKEIQGDIKEIKNRLIALEGRQEASDIRLALLERYAGWPNTLIRILIAAAIGVIVGFGLHNIYTNGIRVKQTEIQNQVVPSIPRGSLIVVPQEEFKISPAKVDSIIDNMSR